MNSERIVLLRTYVNELEARLDAAVLEANGIPAQVFADTAAGAFPSMALVFPVRLLVLVEDVELAREILDTTADASEADDGTAADR